MKKTFAALVAGLIGGLAMPALAQSDFPSRPIVIVVPQAAGGPTDTVTRVLADELRKVMNQQVVVENKSGGGTVVGNTYVANSKPDGYTWLVISGAFTNLPGVRQSMPYDAVKDFSGISLFIEAPLAIVSHLGLASNNLAELIEEARKRPPDRPMTFASSGIANTSHMVGELLQRKVGIKLKAVPYQGQAANFPDTVAGRVDFQIGTWSDQRPHVEAGKLKLISVLYNRRLPEAPNAATMPETVPDVDPALLFAFCGIAVPSGVPAEIKQKISEAMKAATATEAFKNRILGLGSYPRYTSPAETDAFLLKQITTWGEIAKAANIRID